MDLHYWQGNVNALSSLRVEVNANKAMDPNIIISLKCSN